MAYSLLTIFFSVSPQISNQASEPSVDKETHKNTKERVKQELAKTQVEKKSYTKIQLLEMYNSVDFAKCRALLVEKEELDLLVNHSQTPVLLEDNETELTLEELRPRKGKGPPRKRSKLRVFN